jgi:hypothetical protein
MTNLYERKAYPENKLKEGEYVTNEGVLEYLSGIDHWATGNNQKQPIWFLEPYTEEAKAEPMNWEEYCKKCYGRTIEPSELLPISYPFAQSNYTYYLALWKHKEIL